MKFQCWGCKCDMVGEIPAGAILCEECVTPEDELELIVIISRKSPVTNNQPEFVAKFVEPMGPPRKLMNGQFPQLIEPLHDHPKPLLQRQIALSVKT